MFGKFPHVHIRDSRCPESSNYKHDWIKLTNRKGLTRPDGEKYKTDTYQCRTCNKKASY